MDSNVRILTQSTSDSCGAACLAMVLHHLGLTSLDTDTEMRIYRQAAAKLTPGTHFSGLQSFADKLGPETILMHSESGMFKNDGAFAESVYRKLLEDYQGYLVALSPRAKVLNGVAFSEKSIKDLLMEDYLVIIAGQIGFGILHTVAVTGYGDHGFTVCDPLKRSPQRWPARKLLSFAETPIGSWLLAIRQNQSELAKLESSLPGFEHEAWQYLKK